MNAVSNKSLSNTLLQISLSLILLLSLTLTGCGNEDSTDVQIQPKTVFASLSLPSSAQEVEDWLAGLTVQVELIRTKTLAAPTLGWDQLMPLYDLIVTLDEAKNYSSLLMDRSPDPAVRSLAYAAYAQLPQLTTSLVTDNELMAAIETTLLSLEINTPKQESAMDYFRIIATSKYSAEQQLAISDVENNLTNNSLIFYSNAISKSASGAFSAADFACLSEELLSQLTRDASDNYIFDANNNALYYTLSRSCLSEPVRERLHAIFKSKAATENSLLWPTIQAQRLNYAELQDFDDFAAMRLSHTILQNAPAVKTLLYQVKEISDPAFERLQQRYKVAQYKEKGIIPETVSAWSKARYSPEIRAQLLGSAPTNPGLLRYPETFERMLYLLSQIIGLEFVKKGPLENGWNSDVVEYFVYDRSTHAPVGIFLLDPFQVEGGSTTASVQALKPARMLDTGELQTPVVTLKMTLTKHATSTTDISSYNYKTLGHELGHAFQRLLKTQTSPVKADFEEVPSLFFERLVQTPQFLKALLSPDPDEPLTELPIEFTQFWKYNRNSPISYCENTRYQLALSGAAVDLANWQGDPSNDFAKIAKNNLKNYYYSYPDNSQPFYHVIHFILPATDSTYYMYLLADVIAADMLAAFNSTPDSIFNPDMGAQYRYHILENSAPDSEAAITNFLGRKWNYDAYRSSFEEKTQDL